jgi:hypothetical protein
VIHPHVCRFSELDDNIVLAAPHVADVKTDRQVLDKLASVAGRILRWQDHDI